jgi:hypothetical protein
MEKAISEGFTCTQRQKTAENDDDDDEKDRVVSGTSCLVDRTSLSPFLRALNLPNISYLRAIQPWVLLVHSRSLSVSCSGAGCFCFLTKPNGDRPD